MSLKPWREIAVPHEDVLKGTFQQAEFAADLSRVHEGTATPDYQNPTLLFQRTFITEGMRLLSDSVVKRLAGKGGDPVIQLQTAFGGGKTHIMLAVYHLAKGDAPASELPGVSSILDSAAMTDLPRARIAVLYGVNLLSLAKAIKQNLKIKAFVGTSRTAVLTQIWIAMITYLLLAFARHSAKSGWTAQRIMRVIQLNLFDRRSLKSILTAC